MKNSLMLFILFFCLFATSCGKSPLLKELSKENNSLQTLEIKKVFKTSSQEIKLNWLTSISTNEEGKAIILLSKNGVVSSDARFSLGAYLWMKSMGHGSSPIVVNKLSDGIYQLSEMYFTMTGDWQLHITLNQGNQVVEDIEYGYNITI